VGSPSARRRSCRAHEGVVISRDALRTHPFSVQTWDAQSSGTVIKPIAEGALEKRWAELTGKRKPPRGI